MHDITGFAGMVLSDEFKLLLSCCRPIPTDRDRARQQQLASRIDADSMMALALRHKLAPLVYCNLRHHAPGTFPSRLLEQLAKQHAQNKRKAMMSLQTAHQLAATGIRVCTLKGLDVAVRAYGDMAARHVGDIDLLIDEDHLPKAAKHLAEQGWTIDTPEMLSPKAGTLLRRFMPDCAFQRTGYPLLELHWRACANPYEFSIGSLANYQAAKTLDDRTVLNNEDLLIYLCLHGSKHGWMRLKWLFDIPNVIHNLPLDWHHLWTRARQLHADKAVQQALMLVEQLCDFALPANARSGFRFRLGPSHWQHIQYFLHLPEHRLNQPDSRQILRHAAYRLTMQTSLRGTAWQAAALLYPDYRDYRVLPLPSALAWLYIPMRPLLWLCRKAQRA